MSEFDNYPEHWKTNQNLRWWLECENYPEFVASPDDKYIHESIAVDFAKQFHEEKIKSLEARLKSAEESVGYYQWKLGSLANSYFHDDEFGRDDLEETLREWLCEAKDKK